MPALLDKHEEKDHKASSVFMLIALIIFILIVIPSKTKQLRLQYVADNISYYYSVKFGNNDIKPYSHYMQNAIYMIKLHPKDSKKALKFADKAIASVSEKTEPDTFKLLHNERALIKLYYGDKKEALKDFVTAGDAVTGKNAARAAMLAAEERQYDQALNWCTSMIRKDNTPLTGYVCIAHVYIAANSPLYAIDLLGSYIDKRSRHAQAYVERALIEKKINDIEAYEEDIATARELNPQIDINKSLLDNIMDLKLENNIN